MLQKITLYLIKTNFITSSTCLELLLTIFVKLVGLKRNNISVAVQVVAIGIQLSKKETDHPLDRKIQRNQKNSSIRQKEDQDLFRILKKPL